MLTVQKLREQFSYDGETGLITRLVSRSNAVAAGVTSANASSRGYLRIWIDGRSYKAHRVAWALHNGEWPTGQVDHINGDRADNRITNLRIATQSEQNANSSKRRNSKSGIRGVSFHRATGKHTARLTVQGRLVLSSYHDTSEAAAAAYRTAHNQHFGSFSVFKSRRVAD
jgi:hypothetical protein